MSMANDEQDQLLRYINEFKRRPQNSESKKVKKKHLKVEQDLKY